VTDQYGTVSERVRRPGETLMFADSALASPAAGVIEYSFAEPRFHPEYLLLLVRPDPSIHFRHDEHANVAWCDGHVDRRRLSFTWCSGIYQGDPARERVGWFGPDDDNGVFDLD
jgi:prepilin-type processing-associated H-X9-DG protein